VLRGGTATAAASLAFPVIEHRDVVGRAPRASGGASAAMAAIGAVPAVDPAELERARLEAAARGYADGLAAGRDEAVAEVRRAAGGLLARLETAVQTFEARREHNFDRLRDDVAAFAFATVEAMLGRELSLAQSPVQDAIRHALRVAPDRADATVLVHPDDLALVGELADVAGPRRVQVVADASIEPGGCVVRADEAEIDAQLGAALDRLRDVLCNEVVQ
jgi:flagellar assembly protein FliH